MNLKRIFLPEMVAKQVEVLPEDTRMNIESYLENLDVHIATTPREHFVANLVRADEGFVAAVHDADVFFTVDIGLRIAFIRRVTLRSSIPEPPR